MAGPFCGQVLADMGADVIKVEPPGGDSTRRSLGFRMSGDDTAAFLAVNRNKRSLDARPQGRRRTARRSTGWPSSADVVLENNRPGVAARLGVDYETLSEVNPRLVYASISGFGQTGPYAQRPGYDLIAQGLSGVMSVTGEPDGNPVKSGIPIGDLSAGLFCAVAILSALHARERTGRGQYVDTSLFEGALALSIWETAELWATGPRAGQARLRAPPDRAVPGAAHGRRLHHGRRQHAAAVRAAVRGDRRAGPAGRPPLRHQRRPDEPTSRRWSRSSRPRWRARGTDEWVAALVEGGVPCGPIHDYAEVFADPHTQAREMEVAIEHPVEGTIRALGIPVKLSDTPGAIRRPAPLLGQHTEEILREAGFAAAEIEALR